MNPYKSLVAKVKELADIYEEILNPGATAAEMKDFLKEIGLEVPKAFVDFYQVCNGAEEDSKVDVESIWFLPLDGVIRMKKMFDSILQEKKAENTFFFWHRDWLPFGENYGYDTLAIDTSGKATGLKGCVLKRSKDLSEGEKMQILALDFGAFIEGWASRVEEEQIYSFTVRTDDGKNELIDGDDSFYYEDVDSVQYIVSGDA